MSPTQKHLNDDITGKVTGDAIPSEKSGKVQKTSATTESNEIPDDIAKLFSILLETAIDEYYSCLRQESENQDGNPKPGREEIEEFVRKFSEFAANNAVIGDSFFLELEQPAIEMDTQQLSPMAARDIERGAVKMAQRVTPPEPAEVLHGGDGHAQGGEPTPKSEGKQASPKNEIEIDSTLEKHILLTHQQYGWKGVQMFLNQMTMHMADDAGAKANIEKQIGLILQRHGIVADGEPTDDVAGLPEELAGSFEEVALQMSMQLKKHAGDARFVLGMAAGPLAQAVERLEDGGLARERQVALMIHAFAGEPVYHRTGTRPPNNSSFLGFLARLRAMLVDETRGNATPGLLEAQVNLTTWYGQTGSNSGLACGVDLALEILPALIELKEERMRVAKMLHQVANNTAGWLSGLLSFKDNEESMDQDKRKQATAINELHALGTVAFLRQESGRGWDSDALPIYAALGVQAVQSAGSMARAFLFMSNIPSAWRVFGELFTHEAELFGDTPPRYRTAVLALLSALMRARFNAGKDGDEIAQALFNLGVDINIHAKQASGAQHHVPLRVLANGLGLWWALTQARNDDEAIGSFNGGDCAVNLFGALTEQRMEQVVRAQGDGLRLLGSAIHAQLEGDLDSVRLGNSYKQLFGAEPKPVKGFDRMAVAATLAEVIRSFLEDWKALGAPAFDATSLESELQRVFPATTATLLRWAFSYAEQGGNAYQRCVDGWIAVAAKLVALAEGQDYAAFRGKIPATLMEWGIKKDCAGYEGGSIDTHFLSRTLRDKRFMRGVFGLPESAAG